ncbi:MAG: AraC family transcriptional regulator [Chitinophagaceae bacterium]|nr:AraC family transcriptional regulator [Chitinophagaceae bacterium]
MQYQTYNPPADLEFLVKCFWTLEVPAEAAGQQQRILPDGCMEMIFTLGDDIRRLQGDAWITQPRAMVVGQITEAFVIEPTGYVQAFGTRFYPYGFAHFLTVPARDLNDKETPLDILFGKKAAKELGEKITAAADTQKRICIVRDFLLARLSDQDTIDKIVKSTIDTLLSSGGGTAIHTILGDNLPKRRQLERNFLKQVGMTPKQLGKVIRLQTALKIMLSEQAESLTSIAYESEYYDQAHFIRDFKELTGMNPKAFSDKGQMALSALFYKPG